MSIDRKLLDSPAADTSHYLIIRAVDEFNNEGADSNTARLAGPVTPDTVSNFTGWIVFGGCVVIASIGVTAGVWYKKKKVASGGSVGPV